MEPRAQLPVITIAHARKILGADAKGFTDQEIEELIYDLDLLAQAYIQTVQKDDRLRVNIAYYRDRTKGSGSNEVRGIHKGIN
jgi:hypothetical protein